MDGAGVLDKGAGAAMKTATRTTGLIGAALTGLLAGKDMMDHGVNLSNATSLGLGMASAALLIIPGLGEAAEVASLIVDAITIGKDVYDAAKK
jgi:hypothetical protein